MTVSETPVVALEEAHDLDREVENSKMDVESPAGSGQEDACAYKLKAVVKDPRMEPALHAAYCHIKTSVPCSNLLLVLTKSTLTVYDDFHMGDHVAIVAQYIHEVEEVEEKTTLVSATWIPGAVDSEKNSGSARILLALSDGSLAVVDIIESRITQMFNGAFDASGYVLLAAPEAWVDGKEHVCVLGGDAQASVWNVAGEVKVGSIEKEVSAMAYMEDRLVVAYAASSGGGIGWRDVDGKAVDGGPSSSGVALDGEEIDSILPVGNDVCVLRGEREFRLFDVKEGVAKSTFKLKEARDQSEVAFDANGAVAVLGTEDGDGHVFDVQRGEEICQISVVRVSSEVEAVAVSRNGRHIVLAASGFLFRFLKNN